jgi:hypothetical protein
MALLPPTKTPAKAAPKTPAAMDDASPLEQDLCIHIFTVSAAMVGVCLTVIGIIRIVISIRKADTLADDLLAVDAVLFLASCLSSYLALRTRSTHRLHGLEKFADFTFIVALVAMVLVCAFITYAISAT